MNFESRFRAVGYRCAIVGLAAIAVGTGFTTAAIAQDFPLVSGVPFGQLPYEFDNAFFSNGRNFYGNRNVRGQLKFLFGPFPENSIARDGKEVNELYREVLHKQVNSGPIIRTIDLPNPFQYSVRNLPAPPVVLPNEVAPPIIVLPPAPQPDNRPIPQKPVPGLW